MALSKGFELATLGSDLDVNQSTGEVVTINMDTDVVSEGVTNLYFTEERVDDRVNDLLIAGTSVSLTYSDVANTLTIALDTSSGLDLSNNTTDDLPEGSTNLYYTDARVDTFLGSGNATTITTTGDVTVGGNLTVNGNVTTINSTELAVDDLNITIASGAANSAAANGAGITADLGTDGTATMTYNSGDDSWVFNKDLYVNSDRVLTVADDYMYNVTGSGYITVSHTPGPASTASITHAVSGVTAGSYGSTTAVPVITVDLQGHITAISTSTISTDLEIAGDSGTGTIDLLTETLTIAGDTGITTAMSGNTLSIDLDDTSVTPGTYGGTTAIPVVTIDQQGRITSATTASISTSFNISDGTTTEVVEQNDTITFADGTDINVVVSATDTVTINHAVGGANTAFSATTNTFVDEITVTAQGHVTAVAVSPVNFNVSDNYAFKTVTAGGTSLVADSNTDTLTITAGNSAITLTPNATNDSFTISHTDTSSQASVSNSGRTYIQSITLDTYGHITGMSSATETVVDNYVDSVTFNASNGVLTLGRTNALADLTVDLDGRYLEAESDTLDTVTGRGATTTNDIQVGAVQINGTYKLENANATLTTVTQTAIATFSSSTYGSAKFMVQVYNTTTGERQISEILVIHDGTTATSTEYGQMYTGAAQLASFAVDISGGNVRLLATSASTSSTQYKVVETLVLA